MISSRRLAREWALRILYQIDVGKVPHTEAVAFAMDTLRKEFSQRSSRFEKDSPFEPVCLDYFTGVLSDVIPTARPAFEKLLALGASRVVLEAPVWQETRFQSALRRRIPRLEFDPAMLTRSVTGTSLVPLKPDSEDTLAVQYYALTEAEQRRYRLFVTGALEGLPLAMEETLKSHAGDCARVVAKNRPTPFDPDYLLQQRIAFHEHEEARWNRVSEIVEKQIGDWLRTASFVSRLVTGTLENIKEIDKTISGQSEGWKLDRLVSVDHNILRLGCFELLYLPDRVSAVTINEAVELAKKYSTAESGSFVNGVLGALLSKPSAVSPQSPLAQEAESEAEQDTIDLPDEIMELEEETE